MRRVVLGVAVVLVVLLLLAFMFREALTRMAVFYPARGQSRTPEAVGLAYEDAWMTARDGVRIQGWWIPGGEAAVVFFHGNAGTMADRLENARSLHELGGSVLMVEYRGYGDSEGSPSENGLYADGLAAVEEARRRAGRGAVIVFGRSLGGAVAVDVASRVPVDGLVLESTFTSLPDMAKAATKLPFASAFVAYEFGSAEKMRRVEAPVLIIHGDADELVPFRMGEALRDAAMASRRVRFHRVRGGTHNDTWLVGGLAYWDAWRTFLTDIQSRP